VNQYIVTITPVARDGADADARPNMIVRVEVSGGQAHIVELNARAPAGADLASGDLPAIDLKRLAQAFGTPAGEGVTARRSATPPARRATARPSTPAPSRARASKEAEVRTARAYRRMPEPDALKQVYAEIGSIAGVAKHYGVPTHTAQGWIGRLRRLGVALSGS
jgi:hypothetical protein